MGQGILKESVLLFQRNKKMFIKLQFTADKPIAHIYRMLAYIINTPSINSSATLATGIQALHNTTYANLDYSRSTIIRTVSPSTMKAHFALASGSSTAVIQYRFTLQFESPDSPSRKLYMQYYPTDSNSTPNTTLRVSDSITGGSITSTQHTNNQPILTSGSSYWGTTLTPSGNVYQGSSGSVTSGTSGSSTVRTFWAYITDKCFVWCATCTDDSNTGFGTTFNNGTRFVGPFINSMYSRMDYWNTDANGIIPWYYTNSRSTAGQGLGKYEDFATQFNSNYTSNMGYAHSRVFNIVDNAPKIATTAPILYHTTPNLRVGTRSDHHAALLASSITGATTAVGASYSRVLTTGANERFPSADLTSATFANFPLGWDNFLYGAHGGNITEESGVYIYNGDYQPGDTFSVGGKVYMIWPLYYYGGYSNLRIGLSVPME